MTAGFENCRCPACSDEERNMCAKSSVSKVLVLTSMMLLMVAPGFSRDKNETIDATAWGTSTQMGRSIGVTLIIYQYSTPEDRSILVEAFQKGSNQGLVNALERMKAVGHVSITGTLGYDVSYIALIPTPTGRKIRFVTNRLIKFGEAYYDTQSQAFNLSGGEIDLNDQDKSKSAGVLYPAAQLGIDDQGQLSINLRENPWRLSNIIDWKGTPGEN
jgi:hypothetical protein